MADKYWVGNGGAWSDDDNHWALASGGAPGDGNIPTSADDVYFDANSFNAAAQVVEVDGTSSCRSIDWTGATNTPAFAKTNQLNVYGSITFIPSMTISGTGKLYLLGAGNTHNITSAGKTITGNLHQVGNGSTLNMLDNLTVTVYIILESGNLTTNNFDITTPSLNWNYAATRVVNLGSSTINLSGYLLISGAGMTFNAGTSTIKLTGTAFLTGLNTVFNKVELNGTAHTIDGDNTIAHLTLGGTTQTITFTDGTTQTIQHLTRSTGIDVKTLVGTAAAGWAMVRSGSNTIGLDYLALSYSNVTPAKTWYAGKHSTDTVGNSGWVFTDPPTTQGWLVTGTMHLHRAG